jgi:hypothetical protein
MEAQQQKAQAAYTSAEYRMKDVERLSEPWRKFAMALEEGDQQPLNSALAEARSAYSPLGYHILVRGYTKYLLSAPGDAMLHLP